VIQSIGFSNVLHEIQRITALEEKNLLELALKTSEENGELSQAVLSFMRAPGCAYKNKTREDVDEEAVDVMICALATLFKNQVRSNYDLAQLIEKKLQAWQDKIEKERK
jgi:NTP pyrophosphatase (non-canonical NTP hydrolase)